MPVDYKKYPPDWEATRQRILLRANNQCEFCSLKNGQTVYSVPFLVTSSKKLKQRMIWFSNFDDAYRECGDTKKIKTVTVVLTIAHLDHDENNWEVEDDRLHAACQLCHLRYDTKEKQKRINTKTK